MRSQTNLKKMLQPPQSPPPPLDPPPRLDYEKSFFSLRNSRADNHDSALPITNLSH